jgi:hypothetical protein
MHTYHDPMNASDYDYVLPKELIAQAPTEPRDSCRLMVCSVATDEIMFDDFFNLARYLPEDSVLVLNDTKVVPARLRLNRLSGGAVRILFLFNEWKGEAAIKGLPDKGLRDGEALFLDEHPIVEAVSHANEEFTFKLLIPGAEFEKLCVTRGETPLPPYIRSGLDEADLREKYQTLFAANPASVGSSYQGETRPIHKATLPVQGRRRPDHQSPSAADIAHHAPRRISPLQRRQEVLARPLRDRHPRKDPLLLFRRLDAGHLIPMAIPADVAVASHCACLALQ